MQHIKFLCLLMFITAALEMPVVSAQTFRARAMATYNRRGTMIMLQRMSDPKVISGCSRLVLVGTVVSVEYDKQRQIVNFSLQARNGMRRKVHLPKLLYEQQLPIEAEVGLSKLIAGGKRIRVLAYDCRNTARELEADEIKAL